MFKDHYFNDFYNFRLVIVMELRLKGKGLQKVI